MRIFGQNGITYGFLDAIWETVKVSSTFFKCFAFTVTDKNNFT